LERYYDRVQMIWELGFPVFAFDYRGFGRSGGEPTEEGLYADARAALEQVRRRLAPEGEEPSAAELGLRYYGFSLGSALAVQLATEEEPVVLVTEAALSGAQAFLDDAAGLGLDASVLMDTRYDSIHKIDRIAAPKLILHGEDDTFVRPEFSELLYERAVEPKELVLVPGAGHSTVPCPERDTEASTFEEPCLPTDDWVGTVGPFLGARE
jgi:fermentation-respiration switch protein FrsA (DUF1100 family)